MLSILSLDLLVMLARIAPACIAYFKQCTSVVGLLSTQVCKSCCNNPGSDIMRRFNLKHCVICFLLPQNPMLAVQTFFEQQQCMTNRRSSGSSKPALGCWLLQSVCVSHATNADTMRSVTYIE